MKLLLPIAGLVASLGAMNVQAADVYGPFPVTTQNYSGSKTNSVSYSGQIARHLLHNSLKKLAGKGTGSANPELKAEMMAYYAGEDEGRAIIDPKTKGDFVISQTAIDQLSKKKNLKGKTYKGTVAGWPGNFTGPEVVEMMIDKASSSNKGFDPLTGYNYPQLISKFLMGAVFYNQAVDNYLDEKLGADNKPNNKAYKKGAAYTGKEHVWDEAFGYFGAPAHALTLSAKQVYGIAKKKDLATADYNKDGKVDLYHEMTYAHAYYAADFDKSGSTHYLHTITKAFIDGRQLISSAKGKALTDAQRNELKSYADTIKTNWEKVIAEATFKYAGSVYKDIQKLKAIIDSNGDAKAAFGDYGKHWSEMKGFAMALETGSKNLGEVGSKLNRLIGYGPMLLGGNQVSGVDAKGNFITGGANSLGDYMVNMIKVQKALGDHFGLKARKNDVTSEMTALVKSLGESVSAEND